MLKKTALFLKDGFPYLGNIPKKNICFDCFPKEKAKRGIPDF